MKSFRTFLTEAVVGVHEDGSVTLLHGTTDHFAADIMRNGFKPGNPARVAHWIEGEYRLPKDSIYNHVAFEFAKHRHDLDRVFFTTDLDVARQYTIPEVVQDALSAAYSLLYWKDKEELTREDHRKADEWKKHEGRRLCRPAVLAVTLPWSIVGAHAFGRTITLDDFRNMEKKFGDMTDSLNNTSIPISALGGAKITLVK